jgi:Leucine-rich repeat (LRR) protein
MIQVIQLGLVVSQCTTSINNMNCVCDETVCQPTVIDYCSQVTIAKKSDRNLYCSKDDTLVLDKMCSSKRVLTCSYTVVYEGKFPQVSKNSYSKIFFSLAIRNKNYKTVPDLSFQLLSIEQLDLSNNRISVVERRAFDKITGLRSLSLSKNDIKEIDVSYLIDLEVLNLGKNKIAKVNRSMLVNLTKLKYLDLNYNQIDFIDTMAFSRTVDLRYLDLSGNKLKNFVFDLNLSRLVSLNLNENGIGHLVNGVFSNLTSIKILMIEKNELSALDTSLFSELKQLTLLTFDNNYLEKIDLSELTLSLGNLVTLSMYQNNLKLIKSSNSNGSCKQVNKIQDFNLYSNIITEIEPFSFACFGLLTKLDLWNQKLAYLSSSDIFYGLQSLIYLKLKVNSLTRIYSKTFIHLVKLKFLDLSYNELNYLDYDAFQGLSNLTELLLYENGLKILTSNLFKPLTKLSVLNLGYNKLISVEEKSLSGVGNSLKTLKMFSNRVEHLKSHFFTGLNELLFLYLEENQISSIEPETFKDLVNLTELYLAENCIATIDPSLFINMKKLNTLDLSYNVLVELKQRSFVFLKQLKALNLGFNSLVKINFQKVFSTDNVVLLEKLNLDNNVINELDMNWFTVLDRLTHLNLNNNNFNMRVIELRNSLISILPNLVSLKLKNASLQLVRQFNFTNLQLLDLSFSQIDQIMLQNLPFHTIRTLVLENVRGVSLNFSGWKKGKNLNHFDVSSNELNIEDMSKIMISALDLVSLVLKNTSLNGLLISKLDLYYLKKLTYLDLSFNQIDTFLEYKNTELTHLNLAYNLIKGIGQLMIDPFEKLIYVDFSHNLIQYVDPMSFSKQIYLVHLDLSFNKLKLIDQLRFGDNYLYDLAFFSFSDNQFLGKCNVYFDNSMIESFNLAGNNLTDIDNISFNYVHNIDFIDLSRNFVKIIKKSHFKMTSGLKFLFLNRNRIETIESDALAMCKYLLTLDISFNNIRNLSSSALNGLYNLKVLNLSNNYLGIVQTDLLDQLYHLEQLDLTNNSIKVVEEFCFLQNKFLFKIYLRGNPLQIFFKNNTLTGLVSLGYMELPEQVEINNQACLIIQTTVSSRFVKKVLEFAYYYSIDIVTLDLDRVVKELEVYNKTECFQIMYLSRSRINLNLFNFEAVSKFISDCKDHVADAFINNELPALFVVQ